MKKRLEPPRRHGNIPNTSVSKTPVPCFDEKTAALFLGALGKDPKTTRIRAFYEKDDPRKNGDGGRKASFSTDTIKQWQKQGRGVYAVINNGGDEKKDITDCIALFNEWDDKPREWQKTAWKELGLPEPTLQVDSGGRSIHSYWVLASPIPPAHFVDLQKRLAIHCGSDTGICDAPRVMRLPGTKRGNGQPVTLIHANTNRYDASEFEKLLKAPVVQGTTAPPQPTAPPRPLSQIREALSRVRRQ